MTVVTTSSSISTASGAKVGNIAIASGLAVVSWQDVGDDVNVGEEDGCDEVKAGVEEDGSDAENDIMAGLEEDGMRGYPVLLAVGVATTAV